MDTLPHPSSDAGSTPSPHEAEGRWRDLLRPRYLVTTVMLCVGVALYAFNGFLVSTSLPSAVDEFGGAALISWALTLYLAASIVAGACAALLKQTFGSKATLAGAGLLFLAGTLIAGMAQDMETVLVGRVLQGIGEGIVAAICYALIPEMFPPGLIAKVFGAEASIWAIAAFGAPVLAGWLTETISWRAAFLVNVPMILFFLALAMVMAPARPKGSRPPFRLPGIRLALLSAGLIAILVAGVASLVVAISLGAFAALALFAAVRLDRSASASVLPAGAFNLSTALGLGLWVVLLMPVAQATASVYLVYGLQHVWDLGPTAAGAIGAIMAISWSLTAILVASFSSRRHTASSIRSGPLLQLLGLSGLVAAFSLEMLPLVFIAQLVIGAGFGASWAFLSKMLMEESPIGERDKTSALLPTLQSAGFALGAGLAGLVANAAGIEAATASGHVSPVLAIVFLLGALWVMPAAIAARRAVGMAGVSLPDR